MRGVRFWGAVVGGVLITFSYACTVKQQQDVLGGIGTLIPGSRNSLLMRESSTTPSQSETGNPTQVAAVSAQPPSVLVPRNELGPTDAQWVLQTMQRAMRDNPTPFIECLDNTPCRSALTTHLIQIQKLANGTLELPPAYDRYDLQRGKK